MKREVSGAEEMRRIAAEFVAQLAAPRSAATVLTLSGELGAGKTTFAQGLAAALGVEEAVASPTFVIQKIYPLQNQRWSKLVHVDAYRLSGAQELLTLGWQGLLADPGNLIVIEWPERVSGATPEHARWLRIEIGEGEQRHITYDS